MSRTIFGSILILLITMSSARGELAGDFDGNCIVDVNDTAAFVTVVLNPSGATAQQQQIADVNTDGSVNGRDVAAFASQVIDAAACSCGTALSGFAGGDGTPASPYLICEPAHLMNVSTALGASFRQTADIDMSGYAMLPIGDPTAPFTGVYDGDGYAISNVRIQPDLWQFWYDVALFGTIDGQAEIRHLTLNSIETFGEWLVAGLVAEVRGGLIHDCHIVGSSVMTGETTVGGLVASNLGTIRDSSSSATVRGIEGVDEFGFPLYGELSGGFVADNGGLIERCTCTGYVEALFGQAIGGFAAFNGGMIRDSYASGSVIGFEMVGGFVAENYLGNALITRCYASGHVDLYGGLVAGGLVATSFQTTGAAVSFWDTEATGLLSSTEGTGLSTALMQSPSTYTTAGWDSPGVWVLNEGEYPRLVWE